MLMLHMRILTYPLNTFIGDVGNDDDGGTTSSDDKDNYHPWL